MAKNHRTLAMPIIGKNHGRTLAKPTMDKNHGRTLAMEAEYVRRTLTLVK